VFVLGLCTACAYARNGSLLAPVAAHAAYNGAMIFIQA
jgi:ABC-2 type transport system permease protein